MKKILYIISVVLIIVSGYHLFAANNFTALIFAGSGFLLFLATYFGSKLIKESKKAGNQEVSETMSIDMKINKATAQARQDKFKAESEIRRITSWANDAIFTTYSEAFTAAGKLYSKDALLDKYDEIKNEFGPKIPFEQEDKCDNIVKDYKQKIEYFRKKAEVSTQKEQEYLQYKEKIMKVRQLERKREQMAKHDQRRELTDQKIDQDIYEKELEDVKMLNMHTLEDEILQREEYYKQLEQLEFQYKNN